MPGLPACPLLDLSARICSTQTCSTASIASSIRRWPESVLAKSCSSYILNLAHVMDRGPGAEQQLFHRDHDIWPHLPKPHAEVMLASVIALVDFDAENGATRIVPGSHRWPEVRQPLEHEIAVAEMGAGSAVVYLGDAIAAGGGYLGAVDLLSPADLIESGRL